MDKLDFKEKVWGFIFGIIAIASAVAEMISGGISWSAFWGMLKDIASTAVVIVVLALQKFSVILFLPQ